MLLWIVLVAFVYCDDPILVLQNQFEHYQFDLPFNYANASYKVMSIEAANNYTLKYPKPEVTFNPAIQYLGSASTDSMCPIMTTGPPQSQVTLILSPTNLKVFQYKEGSNLTFSIKVSYDLTLVTKQPYIKCTHLSHNQDRPLYVYLDCYTDTVFINVTGSLVIVDRVFDSITFTFEAYTFTNKPFLQYWQMCIKKEVEFIIYGSQLTQLFTCLFMYHTDAFYTQFTDSMIAVTKGETVVNGTRTYSVFLFTRDDFAICSKLYLQDDASFQLQDLVVHPWDQYRWVSKPKSIWDFSLLISNRSGICKCSLDTALECYFLELQDSNYTRLKSLRASDSKMYFYVTSTQYVLRIKVGETVKTSEDTITGFFVLRERGYRAINVFPSLNFVLVQLANYTNDKYYVNQYVKQCILGQPTPETPIEIYKVFQQQQSTENTYFKPNAVLKNPPNNPIVSILNLYRFGNFFSIWEEGSLELSLYQMNYRQGHIRYKNPIPQSTFLLFKVNLSVNYIDDLSMSRVEYTTVYVGIVPFNDTQLAILTDDTSEYREFESQQFEFNLADRVIGPQMQFVEVNWPSSRSILSDIQYVKSVPVRGIDKAEIVRVFFVELNYIGTTPYLLLYGSKHSQGQQRLVQFKFNYSNVGLNFNYSTLTQTYEYTPLMDNIDIFQKGVFTGLIGSRFDNNFYICYMPPVTGCGKITGLKPVEFIQSLEFNCQNDLLIVIPTDSKSVEWYSYTCAPIMNPIIGPINVKLLGQINATTMPELTNNTIVDYHFDLVHNFISALLLSDGTIVILTNYQQFDEQQFGLEVSVLQKINGCLPQASSSIFIIDADEELMIVYVCYNVTDSIIMEFTLPNPYQLTYVRHYSLYGYQLLDQPNAYITDGQIVYLPAEDPVNKSLVFLAYSPLEDSPCVLIQSIFVAKLDDPFKAGLLEVQALSVAVNSPYDLGFYSILFIRYGNDSTINFIQSEAVYYGNTDGQNDTFTQMIMVYQQNTQNILYMPYELKFNFSDSKIQLLIDTLKVTEDEVQERNIFDDYSYHIDTSTFGILGPVEDYRLTLEADSYFAVKNDMTQLQKRLATHYDALRYGQILDIAHLDGFQFHTLQSTPHNLIFAVTNNYLIVIEKTYTCTDSSSSCTMRILAETRLTSIIAKLDNTNNCKISFNAATQLILYCYAEFLQNKVTGPQASYYLIEYVYDQEIFLFVPALPIMINLGSRVEVQQIQPLLLGQQVYHFLKFNYESSPNQSEILVGKLDIQQDKVQFKYIRVLESSSIDFRLIGSIVYDVSPVPDTHYCVMAVVECKLVPKIIVGSIWVRFYEYTDELFLMTNESEFSSQMLNHTVFISDQPQDISFLVITNATREIICIIIGTQDSYYQVQLELPIPKSIMLYTFHKYFQCKDAVWEEPTIVDIDANIFVVTCIGATKVPNIFYDVKNITQESNMVYVQVFSKSYKSENGDTQGWPKRVLESITTKRTFSFRMVYFTFGTKQYLLMENDTYLMENYELREKFQFHVLVSSFDSSLGSVIKGHLELINDYNSVYLPLEVKYRDVGSQYRQLWWIVLVIILGLLFCIILLFVFYTLCSKTNINFKLSNNNNQVHEIRQNNPRRAQKKQEFALLDEAIKEVLGVSKNKYRTKKSSSDSMRYDQRVLRSADNKGSSDSDD